MSQPPPEHLTEQLERLGLATADEVRRMARRVARLAGDLPQFESVWIDALAHARLLTPFQAAEVNAGRAERLRVGPYLLCSHRSGPAYASCYRARRVDSGQIVRLVVADGPAQRAAETVAALESLVAAAARLQCESLLPIEEAGADGPRVWVASPWIDGQTAAEWMVRHGRFPPAAVLDVARAMIAALVTLDDAGLCHGDVSTATLVLSESGGALLTEPGLRAILRPEEGYAHADLPPEAYDSLAPERITEGTPPSVAGDLYACGCVWWQMLCGRPPLSGGNALGKLRAAQEARVFDVRRLAAETPEPLAAAVSACLQRDPGRRPRSMTDLAASLGEAGQSASSDTQDPKTRLRQRTPRPVLARCLARAAGNRAVPGGRRPRRRRLPLAPVVLAGCLAAAAALLWPIWRSGLGGPNEPGPLATRGAEPLAATDRSTGETRDPAVIPAQYQADASPLSSHGPEGDNSAPVATKIDPAILPSPAVTGPPDLVLASNGPQRIESLRLRPGQRVRGEPGHRPLVMVPPSGLPVEAEGVRFDGIDFVWDHPAPADGPGAAKAALIDLRSGGAEFHRCSFRSAPGATIWPVAIRWTHPADPADADLSLPNGRVQLADCVLDRVAAGLDCQTVGALAVEVTNTLQLGGGPMLRLDHCPRSDEPLTITMERVTLRDTGPLLECHGGTTFSEPGKMAIRTDACVFVPADGEPLLLLRGAEPPERILPKILWTGQGSLVSPETAIAAWRGADGQSRVADESAVAIDGLVRGEVGFAGPAEAGPAASQITRWQAPLRSPDAPGIDPAALPGTQPEG